MKKLLLFPYSLIRWIILFIIIVSLLLLLLIEYPKLPLTLLKAPLKQQGITYGKISGGLLSGFTLEDVNYQDHVKAKEVALNIDLDKLEDRLLYIDEVKLTGVHIDEAFLRELIENNTSQKSSKEGNLSLPFDRVVLNHAIIELEEINYRQYGIDKAELEVKNFETDMKKQYKGDLHLLLKSNVTQLDLNGSIQNENVIADAQVVPNRNFIAPFISPYQLQLQSDPHFSLHAKGNLSKVHFHLKTHQLDLKREEYTLSTHALALKGWYDIPKGYLDTTIDTQLQGNMGELMLAGKTALNIHDLNNTLTYHLDAKLSPKKAFVNRLVAEQNITLQTSPTLALKSSGNFKTLRYQLEIENLALTHDPEQIYPSRLYLDGNYGVLSRDLSANLTSNLKSNMDDLKLHAKASLNLNDINQTLQFDSQGELLAHQPYLNAKLAPYDLQLTEDATLGFKAQGDLKQLHYQVDLRNLALTHHQEQLYPSQLHLNGNYGVFSKGLDAHLTGRIKSNIANLELHANTTLNLNDINQSLRFDTNGEMITHQPYLNAKLAPYDLQLTKDAKIHFDAQGDLHQLNYQLDIYTLALQHQQEKINDATLHLNGSYGVLSKDLVAKLDTNVRSNVADLKLNAKSRLNLKDINQSLTLEAGGELHTHRPYLNAKLKEHNLTLTHNAHLHFNLKGAWRALLFELKLQGLGVQRDDLTLRLTDLSTHGKSNLLSGQTHLDLKGNLISNAGELKLINQTQLNIKDLNATLNQKSDLDLHLNADYLNPKLKDQNITIVGHPQLHLSTHGGLEKLYLQLRAKSDLLRGEDEASITLETSPILLNLLQSQLQGELQLQSHAKGLKINLTSQFSGNYTQPKTMQTQSQLTINEFNAFGLNLDPLIPLNLEIKTTDQHAKVELDSERIQLHATSQDYDHFTLDLTSRNLYLYKMIKLPPELDHKFIKFNLHGNATLSRQFFSLKGEIYSNKKFKATINAQNRASGLRASLRTKHLALSAHGDLSTRHLKAKLDIDSLKQVQKEFNALYDFETIKMDGPLHATAQMEGDAIHGKITSRKISFKDFNIEDLDLQADYTPDLILIQRFNLQTTGFKDKKFNKHFYLNQTGRIELGAYRSILIDMNPDIYIQAQGDAQDLQGSANIHSLPLGYPEYGSLILTTNIDFEQHGEEKSITGEIILKKLKIFYEAKFLDPANDPDVVIITKKDKVRKELSENSFMKSTAIDLQIRAPQANYKTQDIDLTFDVKVNAFKAFGKDLALLGKIQEINGRVDQVPKRFSVVDSNIVFKGDKKINPLLDIKVEYELPQVLIHINIGGDANHPKLEFTSEPPMPKKDIMSYLLFGVSTASLAEGEGSLSREAELFILNQAARDLAYEVGLDRIFIKDDGTGEGFAIEAGKKVSSKNMVIIESSKEGNSFILEHDINKNIKLRVGQHQKEIPSQSIDIYFRKKFR